MGTIAPGTNGTLKSITIENMLYEALTIASNWESDTTKNPTADYKIAMQVDYAAKRVTANFSFKLDRQRSTTGAPSFPVQCHLVSTNYAVGSGGFLISTNIYAAIVELCEELQIRDANVNKNPLALNTVTALDYASEVLTLTGSVNLIVDSTTDSTGSVVTRARTYLLD